MYILARFFNAKRVFVQAMSFIATIDPSVINGAEINFVDVDENGLMDLSALSAIKFQEGDVIIPVSLYGNIIDLKTIQQLAPQAKILHDSSQCAGGNLDGKFFSNYTTAEAQSFYITKNLGGVTEGGCILTNSKEIADFAISFRNHGRDSNNYEHSRFGLNCRNNEINASVLCTKLPHLDEWNSERIVIAHRYKYRLSVNPKIRVQNLNQNNKNVYHLFPIFVKHRDKIRDELQKRGISTGKHYDPSLPDQKVFGGIYANQFPIAREIANTVITLPMFNGLRDDEIDYVCENLNELL